jgi:DNA-binding MarR family transcriptional regulator
MDIDTQITENLLRTLLLTAKMLDKTQDITLPEFEITTTSYIILTYIAEDVSTTKQLAQKLQTTYANITHKTKTLEEKGYIQRTVDPTDKRSWQFHLTSNGEAALAKIRRQHSEFAKILFIQFSDKEKQLIAKFLEGIEDHLQLIVQNSRTPEEVGAHAQKMKSRSEKT